VAGNGVNNCSSAGIERPGNADRARTEGDGRATARAADGQLVVVKDVDGLRARTVEVDCAAGDGMACGDTIRIEGAGYADRSAGGEHLGEGPDTAHGIGAGKQH